MAEPINEGGLDFESRFISKADSLVTDYVSVSYFISNNHIYVGGITSPSGFEKSSVAFFQLSAPTLLWVVDWTAESAGKQPDIPNPDLGDVNWILLNKRFEPRMINVGQEGSIPSYRISGTYIYGHKNPSANTINDINFPMPSWLKDSFDRSVPISSLNSSLSKKASVINQKG